MFPDTPHRKKISLTYLTASRVAMNSLVSVHEIGLFFHWYARKAVVWRISDYHNDLRGRFYRAGSIVLYLQFREMQSYLFSSFPSSQCVRQKYR
jgi:hypothetical protein